MVRSETTWSSLIWRKCSVPGNSDRATPASEFQCNGIAADRTLWPWNLIFFNRKYSVTGCELDSIQWCSACAAKLNKSSCWLQDDVRCTNRMTAGVVGFLLRSFPLPKHEALGNSKPKLPKCVTGPQQGRMSHFLVFACKQAPVSMSGHKMNTMWLVAMKVAFF